MEEQRQGYFSSLQFLWLLLGGASLLLMAALNVANPRFVKPALDDNISNVSGSLAKLEFLDTRIQNKATIDTYADTFYIFGKLDTTEEKFSILVSHNGTELGSYEISENNSYKTVSYFGSSYIAESDRDPKKFMLPIYSLVDGINNISVKAYTVEPNKQLISDVSFTLNKRLPEEPADVLIDPYFSTVRAKDVFKELGLDLERDKIWEYDPNYSSPFPNDISEISGFFIGLSDVWTDYRLEKIGKIYVSTEPTPLYKLTYSVTLEGPGTYESSLIFYGSKEGVSYFSDTLRMKNPMDPFFTYSMKASEFYLPDSVFTLSDVPVNDANSLLPQAYLSDSPICKNISFNRVLLSYKSFKVNYDFVVQDQYKNCKRFALVPDYYEQDVYNESTDINPLLNQDFKRLNIQVSDGTKLNHFYNPYYYECGGVRKYRVLNNVSLSNLEKIGKTSTGDDVYIFSTNAPYLSQQYVPVRKGANISEQIKVDEWSAFLSDQKKDYPVVIIKDYFGNWVEYLAAPYLFTPGC